MKLSIKEMVLVSLFAAMTAIGAFISIPVGQVPITLQTLFVILSGSILGPRLGPLSQILYTILGLIGMPIFAGFTGGLQAMMKPSFGFIIGFIFASFIIGKIAYGGKFISFRRIVFSSLVGTLIIYLFGIPYMYMILNNITGQAISFPMLIKAGCLIFLPGDILKAVASSLVAFNMVKRKNLYM